MTRTPTAIWQRIVAQLPLPLTAIDIGARGGVEDHWSQFGTGVRIYGFEPDEKECDRLNHGDDRVATYIPLALGSSAGEQRFYITKDPFCSSLFPPNDELVRERPRLTDMSVREVATIQTQTIDDWVRQSGIGDLGYMKIDAQGAELAILEGSARSLGTVRSLNLEVQFSRLYEDTPLFGDIDLFLRERGFVLWRLGELSHCGFDNASTSFQVPEIFNYDSRRVDISAGGGQLLWANAYYVRRETAQLSQPIDWSDAIRDACLAQAHHYGDLAEVCLRRSLPAAPNDAQAIVRAALASPSTFGPPLIDPVKHLQALVDELKQAADDRLVLIDELKQAADDRLALIDELQEVAAARLQALETTQAQLQAQGIELEQLRARNA
jgi:FkbM family methyltransferase